MFVMLGPKGLLISIPIFILGIAIIAYHPLPNGLKDPYRVQIVMGFAKLGQSVCLLKYKLGFGDMFSGLQFIMQVVSKVVPYPSDGNVKVIKEIISGVPVIIYQPDVSLSQKLYPGIVFFHGGGWTVGSADFYGRLIYNYASQTGAVIFNVDYRLAPDHPFPEPVQDCLDVTRFVLTEGARYNVDTTKVGVAGDSAGGNMAAAVAWKLSKEKSDLHPLLFQVIHYPAMQAFDMLLPSHTDPNNNLPILSQYTMSAMYAHYMGIDTQNIDVFTTVISENRHIPPDLRLKYAEFFDMSLLPVYYQAGNKPTQTIPSDYDKRVYAKIKDVITNPLFSPLMSEDLTGLPQAFIHVCEFDILRDDGLLYARRLQDAGVQVTVHFGKGGYHTDIVIGSTSGTEALSATYTFIRESWHTDLQEIVQEGGEGKGNNK